MKFLFAVTLVSFFLMGCSSGGDSPAPAAPTQPVVVDQPVETIEGKDMSGRYKLTEIACFNSSATLTALGYLKPSGALEIDIQGNSSTESSSDSGCSAIVKQRVVFGETHFALTQLSSSTASGADCSVTLEFTDELSNLSQTSLSNMVSNNSSVYNRSVEYVAVPNSAILVSMDAVQVVGSPADQCFMVYMRQ